MKLSNARYLDRLSVLDKFNSPSITIMYLVCVYHSVKNLSKKIKCKIFNLNFL